VINAGFSERFGTGILRCFERLEIEPCLRNGPEGISQLQMQAAKVVALMIRACRNAVKTVLLLRAAGNGEM
jgi:hypothetical protein